MKTPSAPAPALVSAICQILEVPVDVAADYLKNNPTEAEQLLKWYPEMLPVGSVIGVYNSERSRKFVNLFRRIDPQAENFSDPENHKWEVWWSPTHCVGYFSDSQIRQMVDGWAADSKTFRVNNRISQ